MEKIRGKIKSKNGFDTLVKALVERVKQNDPVSDNAMLDGLIVGFLLSTKSFSLDLFLGNQMGRVLDGTMQKLEQIAIWTINNEDELCRLIDEINLTHKD